MTDRPITEAERAEALAVLSRLRDERPVPPEQAARARELASRDPQIAAELAAWERLSAALRGAPGVVASEGFSDRVMAAMARERGTPVEVLVLPFVRQLAVAAALLVAVSFGWTLAQPGRLEADADLQRQRNHVVDSLRRTPFEADDLDAGLRARLRQQERMLEAPAPPAEARR
jgi:anti-sigma factor RsiW